MADNLYDYLNQQSPQILSALGNFFKSSGLPAYAMSGPGLQQARKRPVANLPADYKKTELEAGAAAEAFRPGAGFPGQQQFSASAAPPVPQLSPQDRAYQQERARVEAMVKSNPDMQKQEIAEARAKVRDQGMEAWAKANPELAKKVMPGQSGFSAIQGVVGRMPAPSDNPLMARTFGYQTGGAPDQQRGADTIGPTPAALQADAALNPASPSFVGGEGAPIYDFTRDDLTPELLEKFQQELLSKVK